MQPNILLVGHFRFEVRGVGAIVKRLAAFLVHVIFGELEVGAQDDSKQPVAADYK